MYQPATSKELGKSTLQAWQKIHRDAAQLTIFHELKGLWVLQTIRHQQIVMAWLGPRCTQRIFEHALWSSSNVSACLQWGAIWGSQWNWLPVSRSAWHLSPAFPLAFKPHNRASLYAESNPCSRDSIVNQFSCVLERLPCGWEFNGYTYSDQCLAGSANPHKPGQPSSIACLEFKVYFGHVPWVLPGRIPRHCWYRLSSLDPLSLGSIAQVPGQQDFAICCKIRKMVLLIKDLDTASKATGRASKVLRNWGQVSAQKMQQLEEEFKAAEVREKDLLHKICSLKRSAYIAYEICYIMRPKFRYL